MKSTGNVYFFLLTCLYLQCFLVLFNFFSSFSYFPHHHPGGEVRDQGGGRPGGKDDKHEKEERVKENIANTSK